MVSIGCQDSPTKALVSEPETLESQSKTLLYESKPLGSESEPLLSEPEPLRSKPEPLVFEVDPVDKDQPTDCYGDPLPFAAVARLGTIRFRHHEQIRSVDYTPDGRYMVSGSFDGRICVWDAISGKKMRSSQNPAEYVFRSAISADGRFIGATRRDMKNLWVENLANGERVFEVSQRVTNDALALSPVGTVIASAFWDQELRARQLRVWDFEHNILLHTFPATPHSCEFSPDGKLLAAITRKEGMFVWDLESGDERWSRAYGDVPDRVLAFAPDAQTLALGNFKDVRLLDIESGKLLRTIEFENWWGRYAVDTLSFSSDGKRLAVGVRVEKGDAKIAIFDVGSGERVSFLSGHHKAVNELSFSPDDQTLASCGGDNLVRRWDTKTWEEKAAVVGYSMPVSSVAFHSHDRTLVSRSDDGSVWRWDLTTAKVQKKFGERPLAFSPDGSIMVKEDKGLRICDAITGATIHDLGWFPGLSLGASAVAFSPDGEFLAVDVLRGQVKVWNTEKGDLIHTLSGNRNGISDLTFSPDVTMLAAVGGAYDSNAHYDDTIQVWDVLSGQLVQSIPQNEAGNCVCLTFIPGSKRIAVGRSAKRETIEIWDAQSGKLVNQMRGNPGSVQTIAVSRDGTTLGSAGSNGAIEFWDCQHGHRLAELSGHLGGVQSLAFSPDGTELASGGDDTTVLIWNVTQALSRQTRSD
tara:strand:+ start:73715 stop:75799 length:2085 start_codon:yes stop_codon:yes gene_type:complete